MHVFDNLSPIGAPVAPNEASTDRLIEVLTPDTYVEHPARGGHQFAAMLNRARVDAGVSIEQLAGSLGTTPTALEWALSGMVGLSVSEAATVAHLVGLDAEQVATMIEGIES